MSTLYRPDSVAVVSDDSDATFLSEGDGDIINYTSTGTFTTDQMPIEITFSIRQEFTGGIPAIIHIAVSNEDHDVTVALLAAEAPDGDLATITVNLTDVERPLGLIGSIVWHLSWSDEAVNGSGWILYDWWMEAEYAEAAFSNRFDDFAVWALDSDEDETPDEPPPVQIFAAYPQDAVYPLDTHYPGLADPSTPGVTQYPGQGFPGPTTYPISV